MQTAPPKPHLSKAPLPQETQQVLRSATVIASVKVYTFLKKILVKPDGTSVSVESGGIYTRFGFSDRMRSFISKAQVSNKTSNISLIK